MNNETTPTPVQTPAAPEAATASKPKLTLPKYISIKVIVIVLALIAILGLLYYYKSVFIAATVNGNPISRVALVTELEKQYGRQALDNLISQSLINGAAKKNDIKISEDEISAEIKRIEETIAAQGGNLNDVLESQGMDQDDLREQVVLQIKAEKLIGDKIQVTTEEIDKFIADNQVTLEVGKEEQQKNQVRDEIKQQKFSAEIGKWLNEQRTNAKINEYITF